MTTKENPNNPQKYQQQLEVESDDAIIVQETEQDVDNARENISSTTIINQLEEIADKYTTKSTPFLIAIQYGSVFLFIPPFLLFVYSIMNGIPISNEILVLLAFLLSANGIATGIIRWRGSKYQHEERKAQISEIKADAISKQLIESYQNSKIILDQYNSLPDEAPHFIKDNLWQAYNEQLMMQRDLRRLMLEPLFDEGENKSVKIEKTRDTVSHQNMPQLTDYDDANPSHSTSSKKSDLDSSPENP